MEGTGYKFIDETERRTFLQGLLKKARGFLLDNKNEKKLQNGKGEWKEKVLDKNIVQLGIHIKELNAKLGRTALSEYVLRERSIFQKPTLTNDDLLFLLSERMHDSVLPFQIGKHSLAYSIDHDLPGNTVGKIEDHLSVAFGASSPDIFEHYCEGEIDFLKETVFPYLENRSLFQDCSVVLIDICNGFSHQSPLAINILINSLIESMVKALCRFVYKNQFPNDSAEELEEFMNKSRSLEDLISQAKWKQDIPVRFLHAVLKAEEYDDPQFENARKAVDEQHQVIASIHERLAKFQDNLTIEGYDPKPEVEEIATVIKNLKKFEDEFVHISLRTELNFLTRMYKDSRNSLIHGDYKDFNTRRYCIFNFSAIKRVYSLIRVYEGLYGDFETKT